MVKVGIETDRGQWVAALVAARYDVFAINPMSVAGIKSVKPTSGAKSDAADAHLLTERSACTGPITRHWPATPPRERRSS